jgi:hypothetical protein
VLWCTTVESRRPGGPQSDQSAGGLGPEIIPLNVFQILNLSKLAPYEKGNHRVQKISKTLQGDRQFQKEQFSLWGEVPIPNGFGIIILGIKTNLNLV